VCENKDGLRRATVHTVSVRVPEVGDKFASRCGQKGVVGAILNSEDMPWTADGIQPDLIINPHAIPSRMTVSQLIESLVGKLGCLQGHTINGTPGTASASYETELAARGLPGNGYEMMYSGTTGLPLSQGRVFLGVTYYQRLKHMVRDKMQGRSTGRRQILTRQPVEGRSRHGGQKWGEMERDALISHGASSVIIDGLMNRSDPCTVWICRTCKRLSEPPAPKNMHAHNTSHRQAYCRFCTTNENQVQMQIPYVAKLLTHELNAVHIDVKLQVSE
jgi:DNA-directed RNA polymerase II subunit RPB2